MLIGIKNASKLIGISIITCCAALICTMFLNFYFDVQSIAGEIASESAMLFYNAQISMAKIICLISGSCLLVISIVMLVFYIKNYIDTHKKELGILKALGYSNPKIAGKFWIFGISVLYGAATGFGGAYLLMPTFYALQNQDLILPEIAIHFHPTVLIYFVILPTVIFSLLAVTYAWRKLKKPVLWLLKNDFQSLTKAKKYKEDNIPEISFMTDLKKTTLKSKKVLVFFIIFASFSFSSLTQMSFSMKDMSSEMMGAIMLIIGLILAITTLFLSITTVIKGNTKTIAMMRVFGYSQRECGRAILGGYRPISYIGFAIGTVYQYALLRMLVNLVFKGVDGVPAYHFDFLGMLISLVSFIIFYELLMFAYSNKIGKISIQEIMVK